MNESACAFGKGYVNAIVACIRNETNTELRMVDRVRELELRLHAVWEKSVCTDLSFEFFPDLSGIWTARFRNFFRARSDFLFLCCRFRLRELERLRSATHFALHFRTRWRRVSNNNEETIDAALLAREVYVSSDRWEFSKILCV